MKRESRSHYAYNWKRILTDFCLFEKFDFLFRKTKTSITYEYLQYSYKEVLRCFCSEMNLIVGTASIINFTLTLTVSF